MNKETENENTMKPTTCSFRNTLSIAILAMILSNALNSAAQSRSPQTGTDSVSQKTMIPVAFGATTKEASTYSISTVSGAGIINNSVYNPGNALYGKLTGLYVIQGSGEPGSDEPSLFIRGRSTTKTVTPLILVDGVERNLNDVQLEDIDAITVLKDASASVMYGIRGANGVIVVTTKRGKIGKLVINGKVEHGAMTPTRTPEFLGSADYAKLYNQALQNDGLAPAFTPAQISGYENGNPYFYPNVDWNKEVLNSYAPGTKANFDVSGGDKLATYYVSLGYFKQNGLFKNTDINEGYSTNIGLDNMAFRSNLDLNVNKNWTFGLDLSGRAYQKNAPSTVTATTFDLLYKYPSHLFPLYVQDGVYGGSSVYPNNPIGYINSKGYRRTNNRVVFATLSTNYDLSDLLPGMSAGLRYATDNVYSNQEGYTRNFAVRELLGADATGKPLLSSPIGTNTNIVPFGPSTDAQKRRNTFEGNVRYVPEIGDNHQLTTQLVYHQDRLIIGSESSYNFQFLSGRANYGLKGKYFAEIGASYSGTEAFPKGNRFGLFPAVSAAWLASEEDFLKNNTAVNYLKLRASAGQVGNSSVNERFSNRRQYIPDVGYNFGSANAAQPGSYAGVTENFDFTWETATKYDAGLDTRLFNALDLSLTYFFEERKDILVSGTTLVPGIFGGDLPNLNAGVTRNRGFEATLSLAKQKSNWGYGLTLNVSRAKNKIQYFPELDQPNDYLYRTGQQINQPFILEAAGFFKSAAEIAASPVQTFGPVIPGDIKYKDHNGDGRIDDFDTVPMGNTSLPSWEGGLDLSFNFKGFDLNALVQGQAGRSVYLGDAPYLFWPLTDNGARISTYASQTWTPASAGTATYPRLTTLDNKNNYRPSTFWMVNGDFLRLRSLTMGYSLPQKWIRHAKMRQARLFVRGMNLFTSDHLDFTDPEVLTGYPVLKSFNAGFSLQF